VHYSRDTVAAATNQIINPNPLTFIQKSRSKSKIHNNKKSHEQFQEHQEHIFFPETQKNQ